MVPVIMTLGAFLRQGDYCRNVQFDTDCKSSAWYSNAYDTGSAYLETTLGDANFTSASPILGEWYTRQARGMTPRMGVSRLQNKALTLQMALALDDMLETDWQGSNDITHCERIEELMSFVLIGFGAGLREDEISLVSQRGLLHFWDEIRADLDPFIMVTLYGRFKDETGYMWYYLPICDHNRSSILF